MKYTMGIDIGTFETKGVLCDMSGNIISSEKMKHDLISPQPGFAEHDPLNQWWREFCFISNELIKQSGVDHSDIVGVGCSAIMCGLTFVDEDLNPLRNAILYGIDTRCQAEIDQLNSEIGEKEIVRLCGEALSVESFGPKMLWVKNHEPEVYKKTKYITMAPGFINLRLTGKNWVDGYSASSSAPLYSNAKREWIPEMSPYVVPLELLPQIGYVCDVIGEVTETAADETGLKAGTPVICGTTDAGAEAFSGGITSPGETMVMYGSTIFVIHLTDKQTMGTLINSDNPLWKGDYIFPDSYAVFGAMATTGSLTRWLLDTLGNDYILRGKDTGEDIFNMLFEGVDRIPVGSDGLFVLPYFAGERLPIKDPLAKGMIFGLNLRHTRDYIVRAALEGIGYGLAQNLDEMKKCGVEINKVTAIGGGTKNPLWMRIMSDITGTPHRILKNNAGASYGDAMLAALGTGYVSMDEVKQWNETAYRVEPNLKNTAYYEERKPIFKQLYENTKDLMHLNL